MCDSPGSAAARLEAAIVRLLLIEQPSALTVAELGRELGPGLATGAVEVADAVDRLERVGPSTAVASS